MMLGGITPITYDSRVTRNSGASGQGASVVAAPPVLWRASSTSVRAPDRARYAAATSPLCPPPTTIASYCVILPPSQAREAHAAMVPTSSAPAPHHLSDPPAGRQCLTECSV